MKISRFALALALALGSLPLAAPSIVRADPEPEVSSEEPESAPRDLWDRLLAVEVIGGIDTPYGVFGAAVVVSPLRNLAFDLGGGVSRDGGRVAGGARLVLPHANGALGFRVGFAGGPLSWETRFGGANLTEGENIPATTVRRTWEFVGFVDVGLSLEFRFDFGMYVRLDLGVEHALTNADACVETTDGGAISACPRGEFQPTRSYVGLALGYAFDI